MTSDDTMRTLSSARVFPRGMCARAWPCFSY